MTLPPVLSFDMDKLIVSRMLVQTNSGGGKSRAIRWLLESTHGRVQHIVIDREGEFATLRARFPYVLVGRGGEVAADPRGAKLLARKLMELKLSAVLDLSEMGLSGQREYVARFLESLNHLPRELWQDCLVVIDEAHLFAPEKGKGESQAREAIALLLSIGRKRGYCAVIATQRLAKLDKDVAAECLNKLIGRTSSEDMKRAGEELGFSRDDARDLRALEPGQFWAYGPAIGVEPTLVTTGSVDTRPPPRGAARGTTIPTPKAIKAVVDALKDLPQQEAEEARTAAGMQKRIRELSAALKRAEEAGVTRIVEKPVTDHAAIGQHIKRALAGERKASAALASRLSAQLGSIGQDVAKVGAHIDGAVAVLAEWRSRETNGNHGAAQAAVPQRTPRAAIPPRAAALPGEVATHAVATEEGPPLGKGEMVILRAVAQDEEGVSREQLTVLTGYKRSSRDTYLRRLGAGGYVAVLAGTITATDAGIEALGPGFEPLPVGDALLAHWQHRMSGGELAILESLAEAYPDSLSRDELSDRTEYKRSSRDTYLQRLGARKLITTGAGGTVRASDMLFDEAVT